MSATERPSATNYRKPPIETRFEKGQSSEVEKKAEPASAEKNPFSPTEVVNS